jgi:hypothetical protein
MPQYRLYFLSAPRGSIHHFDQFEASDDDAAIAHIDRHVGEQPLELWTGRRRVGQFESALAISGIASAGLWTEYAHAETHRPRRLFQFESGLSARWNHLAPERAVNRIMGLGFVSIEVKPGLARWRVRDGAHRLTLRFSTMAL